MSFRDILVFLDATDDSKARLKLAMELASAHGARLTGIDASSEDAFVGQWRDRAVALQGDFEAATAAAGIVGAFGGLPPSNPAAGLHLAHYADLLIAPQPEFEMRPLVAAPVPEEVVVTAGVPTLVLPAFWKYRPVGQSIVIAWNASREATRAVHDAMPLLRKAKRVMIFTISADPEHSGSAMLKEHLRRHGVSAQSSHWHDDGKLTVVEALFGCLDAEEADLIVAGAFSRSPWAENFFGGVSRELIRQPSLPVLMSH
jgi:hypothetical protein